MQNEKLDKEEKIRRIIERYANSCAQSINRRELYNATDGLHELLNSAEFPEDEKDRIMLTFARELIYFPLNSVQQHFPQ